MLQGTFAERALGVCGCGRSLCLLLLTLLLLKLLLLLAPAALQEFTASTPRQARNRYAAVLPSTQPPAAPTAPGSPTECSVPVVRGSMRARAATAAVWASSCCCSLAAIPQQLGAAVAARLADAMTRPAHGSSNSHATTIAVMLYRHSNPFVSAAPFTPHQRGTKGVVGTIDRAP